MLMMMRYDVLDKDFNRDGSRGMDSGTNQVPMMQVQMLVHTILTISPCGIRDSHRWFERVPSGFRSGVY